MINMRKIVGELQSKGYKVTYRVRKDGGILITSIDGVKYKAAAGNKMARLLTGNVLSKRRTAQLTKITRERRVKPRKIPVETPADLERYRKRVMRKWRKATLTGSISKRNLRKVIEERGFEGAKAYLEEMERHTEGKAYSGQIIALLSRIDQDIAVMYDSPDEVAELERIRQLITDNQDKITPDQIFQMFDWLYNWEKDSQARASDLRYKIESLLNE